MNTEFAAAFPAQFSLQGKVAIVTGASRGIGFAIATEMRAAGANVLLADRDEAVQQQAEALAAGTGEVFSVTGDVTNENDIRRLMDQVLDQFGRLDILVNNAAVLLSKRHRDIERREWQRVIDTNLTASFFLAQAVSPIMTAGGGGAIINLSSIVGRSARRNLSAYIAAKAGIDGLTRSLACDLAGTGIRVNAIAPGFIETDMSRTGSEAFEKTVRDTVPLRRWGTPWDIASVALFLACEAASYINGQVIYVDGGFTAISV